MACIADLEPLRHLDLAYCWRVTDVGICALSRLTALSHLDLAYCWQVRALYIPLLQASLHGRALQEPRASSDPTSLSLNARVAACYGNALSNPAGCKSKHGNGNLREWYLVAMGLIHYKQPVTASLLAAHLACVEKPDCTISSCLYHLVAFPSCVI